jgi:hypothetical protein
VRSSFLSYACAFSEMGAGHDLLNLQRPHGWMVLVGSSLRSMREALNPWWRAHGF